MKMRSAVWLFLLLLLASGSVVLARGSGEEPKSVAKAAASTASNTEKKNIEEYIKLLRENVRQQKAQLTGAVLQLSADEAKKFWPLYDEYQTELTKLNDSRVKNLGNYAREFAQLTDEKADQLMKEDLNLRKQLDELLARTYARVKQSLGAVTAARFLQIESQLQLIIDLQLDSVLPTGG